MIHSNFSLEAILAFPYVAFHSCWWRIVWMLQRIAASFCITVPKPTSTASQHCLAQQPSPGFLPCYSDMLLQNHAGVRSSDLQTGTMSIYGACAGFP